MMSGTYYTELLLCISTNVFNNIFSVTNSIFFKNLVYLILLNHLVKKNICLRYMILRFCCSTSKSVIFTFHLLQTVQIIFPEFAPIFEVSCLEDELDNTTTNNTFHQMLTNWLKQMSKCNK